MKLTDADLRDRIYKLIAAAKMAATFTPDPIDDAVFDALNLILLEPKVLKNIRAVAEALPQHRASAAQAVFAEGL